jgi:hypothetical protein
MGPNSTDPNYMGAALPRAIRSVLHSIIAAPDAVRITQPLSILRSASELTQVQPLRA